MMMVVGSLHPANLLGRCRGLVKGVPGAPTRCRTEEREGQLSSKACDGLGSNCDRRRSNRSRLDSTVTDRPQAARRRYLPTRFKAASRAAPCNPFAAMAQGMDDDRRGQRQLRVQMSHRFYLLCGATVMCHVTSTSTSLEGSEGSTTTTPEMWMVCSPTDSGASRRA